MATRPPKTFIQGWFRARVLSLGDGRFAFSYQHPGSGRRIVVKRRTLPELRAEFDRIAPGVLNAETAAHDLTAEKRRIAAAAFEALAATGLSLDTVAREVAAAHAATGGTSIPEITRLYLQHRPAGVRPPSTPQILAELIAQLTDDQRAAKYIRGLDYDLRGFAEQHPDLARVSEADLRAWLRTLTTYRGGPISARRRDNYRDAIVRLFRFARAHRYLPEDRKTVAEKIDRIACGSEVTTYSPPEIGVLLEHCAPRWRPWMLIGAFAGLRTSEIFRLDWNAFKWGERDADGQSRPIIAVSRKIARKVRISRLVPISENLAEWLQPYREAVGPLYPQRKKWRSLESAHQRELNRISKATGLVWENNALRHSFGSHRLAIVKSIDQVALEMGNSPAKVRENYNDPKSEEDGQRYFAILPPDHRNVTTFPLDLQFG